MPRPQRTPEQLQTWLLVDPAGVRWSLWEVDNAVFHAETGETHLLSELPTFLVQMLATGALRTSQLCSQAAAACGATDDAAWRASILAMLERLEELELVEQRPAPAA